MRDLGVDERVDRLLLLERDTDVGRKSSTALLEGALVPRDRQSACSRPRGPTRCRAARTCAARAACHSGCRRASRLPLYACPVHPTTVDWVALGIVAFCAVLGMRRGLIASALSLVGLVAGAYVGARVAPHLLHGGSTSPVGGARRPRRRGRRGAARAGARRDPRVVRPRRAAADAVPLPRLRGRVRARRGRRARARLGDRRDRAAHPRTDPVPAGGARSRSC